MPFDVGAAARFERRVTLKFNQEKLEVFYNAGEKYREYQLKAQQLDQEFTDLQHRMQQQNVRDAENDEQAPPEDVYEDLKKAMNGARRRICDNLCTIITKWDLEGDLDVIKKRMSQADQKRFKDSTGSGPIPIDGAWADALPLPDEFILAIAEEITRNFESGGAGGKGRLKAS